VNGVPHLDTGFALFKEDESLVSPISVIHYRHYQRLDDLYRELSLKQHQLQCVVDSRMGMMGSVKPGMTQFPRLHDFADGVDVRQFLNDL
jgi:hypothetical protein